jgi:electron transfer flavoprotein alpha subunit
VGAVRVHQVERDRVVLDGPVDDQAARAVELLVARGALDAGPSHAAAGTVTPPRPLAGPPVTVVVEPNRPHETRELLGAAAALATEVQGFAVAVTFAPDDDGALAAWGADLVVTIDGVDAEEDAARALGVWATESAPWAVLAPSTAWGREVVSRLAARLGAGLTGDAVALEVDGKRLVAWKPAFGGQLVAAIEITSPVQLATVRVGVLPGLAPRAATVPTSRALRVEPRSRVRILARTRDDDLDTLAEADVVVGVGIGVDPADYDALEPLLECLHAELGATRKVTDNGWLPRARQIGITGRTIAPRLYVSIGASGKFNHMVGVRGAGTVLAVNPDPDALVFSAADVGVVADWHDAVPALVRELERRGTAQAVPHEESYG